MSAEDLAERVEEFRRGLETPVQGPVADFGERVKDATQRRVAAFQGSRANVSAEDESFGEQVRQAAKERASKSPSHQQNSPERAEKDRKRYHKQTRPHTKSD